MWRRPSWTPPAPHYNRCVACPTLYLLGKQKTKAKDTTHECLTCLFLMIKDTLLPTVQKTHIGKYRTFPVSLQTAEGNSQPLSVLRAAPFPVWEDIFRKTSALLMLTTEHRGAKTVTQQGKWATLVYHVGRRRNKLKWIFFLLLRTFSLWSNLRHHY